MGQPAARVTDMHSCPLPGHAAGAIMPPCAPNVLTGNLPQARVSDLCSCGATTDAIAQGAATVLVLGKPAARLGDATAHGGKIVNGLVTVLIGGAATAPPPPVVPGRGSGRGGSTTVAVDDRNHTVTIRTSIEFNGPAATAAYAAAAKQQIEQTWNGTMMRNGVPYAVTVQVDARANPGGAPTAGYDQVVIDPANTRPNQTLYGAGPGHQSPGLATDPTQPRAIAHEYGHTLGLDDGYHDTPTGSVPNDPNKHNDIMAETWPDAAGVMPHPHQDQYEEVLRKHGW